MPDKSKYLKQIIPYCFSNNAVIKNHAIVKIEKSFHKDMTSAVLDFIGDDMEKMLYARIF